MRRVLALAAVSALVVLAPATSSSKVQSKPKVDLADVAAGTYAGEVVSDARGSSQSDVSITVTKIAPNTISVSSDYSRLPSFTTKLTRAMQTIQQVGTAHVFLLDLSRNPHHLDITDDDASWSGDKR